MSNPYPGQLCSQLDPKVVHLPVCHRSFPQGYTIALRPVNLTNKDDLETISAWMEQGYQTQQSVEQLYVMYSIIAECNNSQSYMVLLNDAPVGQLDIYQVSQDVLKDSYPSAEGDFRLHIPVIPFMKQYPDLPVQVVQTCLTYFFSYPDTRRVIWSMYAGDEPCKNIAHQTGFRVLHSFTDQDKEMLIYGTLNT